MRTCLFLALVLLSSCTGKKGIATATPVSRFERELLKPAPATITDVRYDEDLFGDPSHYLAFRCTPADVARIILDKRFTPGTPRITSGFRPAWWKMEELGGSPKTYNVEGAKSVSTLWVKEDETLCYYIHWVL